MPSTRTLETGPASEWQIVLDGRLGGKACQEKLRELGAEGYMILLAEGQKV